MNYERDAILALPFERHRQQFEDTTSPCFSNTITLTCLVVVSGFCLFLSHTLSSAKISDAEALLTYLLLASVLSFLITFGVVKNYAFNPLKTFTHGVKCEYLVWSFLLGCYHLVYLLGTLILLFGLRHSYLQVFEAHYPVFDMRSAEACTPHSSIVRSTPNAILFNAEDFSTWQIEREFTNPREFVGRSGIVHYFVFSAQLNSTRWRACEPHRVPRVALLVRNQNLNGTVMEWSNWTASFYRNADGTFSFRIPAVSSALRYYATKDDNESTAWYESPNSPWVVSNLSAISLSVPPSESLHDIQARLDQAIWAVRGTFCLLFLHHCVIPLFAARIVVQVFLCASGGIAVLLYNPITATIVGGLCFAMPAGWCFVTKGGAVVLLCSLAIFVFSGAAALGCRWFFSRILFCHLCEGVQSRSSRRGREFF